MRELRLWTAAVAAPAAAAGFHALAALRRRRSLHNQDIYFETDELCCLVGKSICFPVGIAVLNGGVFALCVAETI